MVYKYTVDGSNEYSRQGVGRDGCQWMAEISIAGKVMMVIGVR